MPTSYTYHKSIICVCQFLYWNIYKFYTLRSLPQFLISVILACPESFPESFRDRKDSRQAGMTLKTNIQFLTPCGLCRRVFNSPYYSTKIVGVTDMPMRNICCGSGPLSSTIFTGILWTTLT